MGRDATGHQKVFLVARVSLPLWPRRVAFLKNQTSKASRSLVVSTGEYIIHCLAEDPKQSASAASLVVHDWQQCTANMAQPFHHSLSQSPIKPLSDKCIMQALQDIQADPPPIRPSCILPPVFRPQVPTRCTLPDVKVFASTQKSLLPPVGVCAVDQLMATRIRLAFRGGCGSL